MRDLHFRLYNVTWGAFKRSIKLRRYRDCPSDSVFKVQTGFKMQFAKKIRHCNDYMK